MSFPPTIVAVSLNVPGNDPQVPSDSVATSRFTTIEALSTPEGLTSWWGPHDFPVLSASADARRRS